MMKYATPRVIWLSGEHSPRKAELADAVRTACRARSIPAMTIGDGQVRECRTQSCREAEERVHRSLCRLVLTLAEQGYPVIVNSGELPSEMLLWNRSNLPGYFEVRISGEEDMNRPEPNLHVRIPLGALPVQVLASDIVEEVFGLGLGLSEQHGRSHLPAAGAIRTARAV